MQKREIIKIIKISTLSSLLLAVILSWALISYPAEAAEKKVPIFKHLREFREKAKFQDPEDPEYKPIAIIGRVVYILLSLLGVAAVIIVVIGGFKWMTAGGNDEKIKAAKRLIAQGIIGLIIVLAAYAIAWFILERLAERFIQPEAPPKETPTPISV